MDVRCSLVVTWSAPHLRSGQSLTSLGSAASLKLCLNGVNRESERHDRAAIRAIIFSCSLSDALFRPLAGNNNAEPLNVTAILKAD
jgi:hypothetical protein